MRGGDARCRPSATRANLRARIEQVMTVTVQREMEAIEKRMTFLASTGAAAPFVGLFGTVWGIMTAFQGIAISKNTSLAVVAPGIAEALFATALGLVAAIPAVLAYNKTSSDIGRCGQRLELAVEFRHHPVAPRGVHDGDLDGGATAHARQPDAGAWARRCPRSTSRPFVDVMLVLLIIFMVAAPLMNVGVPVDLPKTSADPITGQDEPLVVTVDAKGDIYLGETKFEGEELIAKLRAVQKEKPNQRVFVRGDKAINYGKVMEVLGMLRAAGFPKAGLVGDLSTPSDAPASGAPPAAAPAKRLQPPSRPRQGGDRAAAEGVAMNHGDRIDTRPPEGRAEGG